ncbi:MAG: pantetheine-phosphate adenylyltransferase [Helicobacteraceae bacterium]|nr:pantetheine-phosphate adenylyltransferase [Helicobacteraceae bacterium]
MKKAVYPGSFDPITNGHLDIVKRASSIFDEVIVAVSKSADKKPMFSLEDRVKMAELAVKDIKNARVLPFETLLVEFAGKLGVNLLVRGLRAVSDFEYELQMGYANESLDPNIDTIYLMPSLQFAFVSSSVVRSVLYHNGTVSKLVPKGVEEYIAKITEEKRGLR